MQRSASDPNTPVTQPDTVCVVIGNYDFSANADVLHGQFEKFFPTLLLDAGSPVPPRSPHRVIKNEYYPGLWNAAVDHASGSGAEWLMFVASDLQIADVPGVCAAAAEAMRRPGIGVWSPSVAPGSRCSFRKAFNLPTAGLREVGLLEGFFFLARLDVLRRVHPIPPAHQSGWGVDVATCFSAYQAGYQVVVDDRVDIWHPKAKPSHAIDSDAALRELDAYLRPEVRQWMLAQQKEPSRALRPTEPPATLDLGCGPQIRNPFRAGSLYGVDLRASANPNVRVADLAVDAIPFESNSFDYLTAFDFIEHVPRILYAPERRLPFVALMDEVHRVLKPGGVFLSLTPAYPKASAFQDPTHVNIITEETFGGYFCAPKPWARMYGFSGAFRLISQKWQDDKLLTLMRVIGKPWVAPGLQTDINVLQAPEDGRPDGSPSAPSTTDRRHG